MLREVDRRRLVGRSLVIDDELVLVVERIRDRSFECSRISFFAIGTRVAERDATGNGVGTRLSLPEHLVKSFESTVQRVRRVVDRELVRDAVEREPTTRNTV